MYHLDFEYDSPRRCHSKYVEDCDEGHTHFDRVKKIVDHILTERGQDIEFLLRMVEGDWPVRNKIWSYFFVQIMMDDLAGAPRRISQSHVEILLKKVGPKLKPALRERFK